MTKCGKISYSSKTKAIRALLRIPHQNLVRTYWCAACKAYHLTSSVRRKGKK